MVHCLSRTVRRAFLCGRDAFSGRDFEHRRGWIEKRIEVLAGQFGIAVLGFSVMSTQLHIVLRNRPEIVAGWSDAEVARRWRMLSPARRGDAGSPAEPSEPELNSIVNNAAFLLEVRARLSDISWFMKMIAEPIARRANREGQCTGHFWEGRFKSIKLCDEAAILACGVYVDLNPIRAGIAQTPETSDHTSGKLRSAALAGEREVGEKPSPNNVAWASCPGVPPTPDGGAYLPTSPQHPTECLPVPR